jgi:hypothetical protein
VYSRIAPLDAGAGVSQTIKAAFSVSNEVMCVLLPSIERSHSHA